MDNKFLNFINLHNGEEQKEKVLENVAANIPFRGSNLWILACAILIASVGLNVNSTAVIIGAMLISPLMGPIVGAGFALATLDFHLMKRALKNLLIATLVSVLVSSVYFYLSPFKEVQSELLARTSPTFYDVLIAFFGGIVGVVAITRVEKGNPIPGVAIATALMPPLCTAGYGLATFNFSYFAGAFYLYSINCFFICVATFLIVRYLKYDIVKQTNKLVEKRIRYAVVISLFLMLVPSFYLAYNLLKEKEYSQNAERFIETEFINRGYTVIYKDINYAANPKSITVAFLVKKFKPEEIKTLNAMLDDFGLHNTKLIVKQDVSDLKSEILTEIGTRNKQVFKRDMEINALKNELNTYKIADTTLSKELKILYPEIRQFYIGTLKHTDMTADSTANQMIFMYQSDQKLDSEKIKNWLQARFDQSPIQVVYEKIPPASVR